MRGRRFRLKPGALVAASVALLFAQAPSWANPTGPQVVSGTVGISQPGAGILNITNTPGSIINWQGFSIGAGEVTRFIQQSASSAVLNRVIGGNASQIYGQLLSNGRVFLINPGGIVVGPGAMIDTAGFVGSTLNMLDSDFLAGKLRFQGDSSSGSIVNQGWIRTGYGGQVILVAPSIQNSGLIHTPGGELILAAGQKLTISSLDTEGVQFEVQAPTDSVLNVGRLLADGGAVGVFAGTLRHSGDIRANSLVYDEAGKVVLKAQNEIQLAAGSATTADGRTGGSITVQAGGSTRVAGTVSATGSAGTGGSIAVLGDRVSVVESASLNASGSAGGGQILVGGDYQGANPAIQNSTNTFVASTASLKADATQSGDGGRVIVWSDDKTQVYGTVSAQGGPQGGNGGFAEISGKQGLVFQGSARLGATQGSPGTLLLDPLDLYVFAGGGIDLASINELTEFPQNAATVSPATLDAAAASVVLQASRYMRITDAIALNTPGAGLTATVGTYTVPASPDPLSLSSAASNILELNAGISTVGGAVSLTAPIIERVSTSPALTIDTSGGAISLSGGRVFDVFGSNVSLNAGSGAITANATAGSIRLGSNTGGTFTANATGSITTTGVTTTGAVTAASSGTGSVQLGTVAAGSGAISMSGGFLSGTLGTIGPVTLTSSASSISAAVNGASSVTATAPSNVTISSNTNVNVANVTAGTTAVATVSTTNGSILGVGATPLVKGMDVTLQSGAGGGIGTAGTPINVDVQRTFTFRPTGDFNVLVGGSGPVFLNAQFVPAVSGTYSGTVSKAGAITLDASADTSTVTVSNLNITGGFDQTVFFQSPRVQVTTSSGNLVLNTVNVPTGDTVPTLAQPNGTPFEFFVQSAGNLTINNYTRAGGGLPKATNLTASGTVTLGAVDASKDTVVVTGPAGITVGSVVSTGNVTLQTFTGPVNAQNNTSALEVSSGGTVTISGVGIGTNGFANPFDIAGNTVTLTSSGGGAIGPAGAVTAATQNLTVNAGNGSTFNVTTGATPLTSLSVTANPTTAGTGTAHRVNTNGQNYDFDVAGGNFTLAAPASTSGRNFTFTATSGNVNLPAMDLGTGTLSVTATSAGIATGGANLSAASVTLNAATTISMGVLSPGTITSTGSAALHGRTGVSTGPINVSGNLTIDGCFSFCGSPAITTGALSAAGVSISTGSTISVPSITATDNVTLQASGGLTLGGSLVTANGKSVLIQSGGGSAFSFSRIDAGANGTVSITASAGIQQTTDGGSDGVTAKTVSLLASNGAINKSVGDFHLDVRNTTNLTLSSGGTASDVRIDANTSTLTDLTITQNSWSVAPLPIFDITGMTGQTLTMQRQTDPIVLTLSSGTPLNFNLTHTTANDIKLGAGGISTGGGNLTLTSAAGIDASSGAGISTGAGSVTLLANSGNVNLGAGVTTTNGAVDVTAFGTGNITTGAISTSGGRVDLNALADVTIGGNLNAGAGAVSIVAGIGSVTRTGGSQISSSRSVNIQTSFGDIGTSLAPMLITSPTVTLDAPGDPLTVGTGHAFATLTGTSVLGVVAENGFNVSSDTALTSLNIETAGSGTGTPGAGTLNLAAPGQTYTFARPAADLFGPVTNTFQVVAVSGPTDASFTALDGTLLVAGPSVVNVPTLTLGLGFGGGVSLQGTSANPLSLSGTTQSFSAGTDLVIRGKVTLNATSSQLFSAGGNITVNADAGGGGAISISAPSQTFSTVTGTSKMEFLGGAAAGEKVTVTSTNDQFVQTTSSSIDAFKLLGGSGADSSVTFTHSGSGSQTFQMSNGALTVAGGSGSNSFAKLEETGTNAQRICFQQPFGGCTPILTLNVLGGSGIGAFAQLTSAGAQTIGVSGSAANTGTTIKGGTGSGAYALVQAGTSQTIFGNGRLLVEGQGALGAVGTAQIVANGFQDIDAGSITVKAGASDGSLARIFTTGGQDIRANAGALTLIAPGVDAAGFGNASATIEGSGQSVFASGGITINAGSGTSSSATADALIRNNAGSQSVTTSGALILDGGHQFSTAGIINAGTGTQIVSSFGSGITLRSDTDGTHSPHADSSVVIQNQAATLQSLTVSGGGLRLTNSGGGTVGLTSAGSQDLSAMFVEVLTNPSTEAGPNSATISAATTQKIVSTNTAASGFPSMRVAALGAGTASVTAGEVQLIELDYPAQMQFTNRDGRLIIGDVNAAGISRVRAGDPLVATPLGNQTIFAKSITVQAGLVNSISELKATGTQVITTLQGGIDVLGGSGDNSLAQIDPVQQTILSNGPISVIAGTGVNANAQIIASSGTTPNGQTILTTNGDITLEAGGPSGTSASSAFITNTGSSSFVGAAGEIFLTPGTVAGADAIINVGNGPGVLTVSCGLGCSLPPVGASPTGGVLANSSGSSTSSSTSPQLDVTTTLLPLQDNVAETLIEVAPTTAADDPSLLRRAPTCR